jgi:hypothetical protein
MKSCRGSVVASMSPAATPSHPRRIIMNVRVVSTKLGVLVSLALALPACIGAPGEVVDDPSSLEARQSAYTSQPPPESGSNSDTGGSSSGGGGSTSGPPSLAVDFDDCTSDTRSTEMRAALDDILAHWGAFEANLNARGLTSDHDCMYNRLTDNGNVQCDVCDVAGHSILGGRTANVCRSWATSVENSYPDSDDAKNRKVCWASVIMHEFGHTCVRLEGGAEKVDNAARETLNDVYGTSLDLDSECNQD